MDLRQMGRSGQADRSPSGRRSRWRGALLLALPALLLACGGGASPTSAPTAASVPTTRPATATALPARTTATAAATATASATASRAPGATATRAATPSATATRGTVNYPDVVRLAIEALAAETGVPREQIVVARVEPHDWPDSSLGCPQPGRAYLQVVTPGYRVFLAAGGREYEYHTNQTAMIVRCSS